MKAKKIEVPKSEVPKLAEVMRCHIRQTVSSVSEVVEKIRESADRASARSHIRLVKVSR
jgi:hypothetical protein